MSGKSLQVLLVEDSAGDARLIHEMLRAETPGSFILTHVGRMSEALGQLAKGGVDIVLLDMGLPDGRGLDTVRRTHAAAPDVPLIVLTGMDDEIVAAEAMKEGAQDFLIKGQIENRSLPRVLRYAIERNRVQEETDLLRRQQLQLKDEFLSHVSHELRSPLTAIYQFVSIVSDGLAGEVNPQQQEYLEIALRNSRQLRSMIDDLLEVTRLQTGAPFLDLQLTSVPAAVTDAVTTLRETAGAKGIQLTADVESQLASVYADPTRVRQILIILIDNALKFTPANGAVRVRVRVYEKDQNFQLVEVSDTGCGIPADMTERVFDRLYQAPDTGSAGRKGLGLGLHICKTLVAGQGGRVWATSEAGKGSTFSFTLPIFSIARLIAPAFQFERTAENSVVIVETELGSRTGWLSRDVEGTAAGKVRDVLGRCMHSELDVLLPKMGSAAGTELFFIVAVTHEIGGKAITRRIQERLAMCGPIREAGLTCSVSYRLLQPGGRDVNESMEDYIEKIALSIQDTVNQEISHKAAKHE